jgi:hypothetical protein
VRGRAGSAVGDHEIEQERRSQDEPTLLGFPRTGTDTFRKGQE